MKKLLVTFAPCPIPWVIHKAHGVQTTPGEVKVALTVRAIDSDTLDPVTGTVDTTIDPTSGLEDPNHLHFKTNEPRRLHLFQLTSDEGPRSSVIFVFPRVQISADGYEDAFLDLDDRKQEQ
jgi:hypothetical protein